METKRIFIFANGILRAGQTVKTMIGPDDGLIAADGGGKHLDQLGLIPDYVIGDLDSISPRLLKKFKKQGSTVLKYSVDKDETDLELALSLAVSLGAKELWVVAALGGRLDQTLGNLGLLDLAALQPLKVRLEDGLEEVWLIHEQTEIDGKVGDGVSLIPWKSVVTGVKTEGLKYPLNHETLFPEKTRGISNVLTQNTATVSIDSGLLLCIHTRKTLEEQNEVEV
jgi:thiamine pyrophosphokinase